jgi:hypothetical protein
MDGYKMRFDDDDDSHWHTHMTLVSGAADMSACLYDQFPWRYLRNTTDALSDADSFDSTKVADVTAERLQSDRLVDACTRCCHQAKFQRVSSRPYRRETRPCMDLVVWHGMLDVGVVRGRHGRSCRFHQNPTLSLTGEQFGRLSQRCLA